MIRRTGILSIVFSIVAGVILLAEMGCSKVTSMSNADGSGNPSAEEIVHEIMGQWSESESIRYNCKLNFLLSASGVEKSDYYDVEFRARKPKYLVLKAQNDKTLNVLVYNGEYLFFHTPGNRFSRAPLEGDLKTLQNTAKLAAFPMVLMEMFIADTSQDFLSRFDSAFAEPIEGGTRLILTRNRETVTFNLLNDEGLKFPLKISHTWTFPGENENETNPDLSLTSVESYQDIQTGEPIALDEMSIATVAAEVIADLEARGLLVRDDGPSSPTLKTVPESKKEK
jgi:hypothetical protein